MHLQQSLLIFQPFQLSNLKERHQKNESTSQNCIRHQLHEQNYSPNVTETSLYKLQQLPQMRYAPESWLKTNNPTQSSRHSHRTCTTLQCQSLYGLAEGSRMNAYANATASPSRLVGFERNRVAMRWESFILFQLPQGCSSKHKEFSGQNKLGLDYQARCIGLV